MRHRLIVSVFPQKETRAGASTPGKNQASTLEARTGFTFSIPGQFFVALMQHLTG